MSDLVVVGNCKDRIEASEIKCFFEANNIKAFVSADDEGGLYPFPLQPTPTGSQVFVLQEDYKKARKLLNESQSQTPRVK